MSYIFAQEECRSPSANQPPQSEAPSARCCGTAEKQRLTEVAGEAGLSPAHLSEVERGRKEVSTKRLLAVAHALGVPPADIYADLARLLGADSDHPGWPEDPPVKLRLATASLPLEALRSVADFSAYLAMTNPPPKPKGRIGFDPPPR